MADRDELSRALARAATELEIRNARIEGLELLGARSEEIGREAVARLAELLRTMGVAVEADSELPSRLPELVTLLMEHLIPARNQLGVLAKDVQRLADEVKSLEQDRDDLRGRVQHAETRDRAGRRAIRSPHPERNGHARLKILMVLHDFLPRHRGGTEVYAWRVSKALAARNDVHLFFTEAHPQVPSHRVREGSFDGLPFTEVSHQHVAASFEESWRDSRMEKLFRDELRRMRPDVVHIQHLAFLSLGFIAEARAAGIPVVYTLHDYALLCPRGGRMLRADFERCERPVPERCAECMGPLPIRPAGDTVAGWTVPEVLRKLFRASADPSPGELRDAVTGRLDAVRKALSSVDLMISPSRWLRRTFVESGFADADRIVVSENGQDPEPFRAAVRRSGVALRVGYIGAIVPAKGVHVLVTAMSLLSDLPHVEAFIHGVSDADPAYAEGLRSANKNAKVSFAGDFAPEAAAAVLAGLDVLVVPSLWWENSPLTIQEAFLAGVPVVVSGIGGMAEKVIDGVNGLHFPAGDSAALAARLRALHDDRDLLVRLSANRPIVKTVAEDARDLEARYRDLVGAGPRARA